MNKKTRALVTGAAGVAILLSTGATFALWNAEIPVVGETQISTGAIEVGLNAPVWSWVDISPEWNSPREIRDISDFEMVPGDVIRGTLALGNIRDSLSYTGDNLYVELQISGELAFVDTLPPFMHHTINVDPATQNIYVTLDWNRDIPAGGINKTVGRAETMTLSGVTATVQQVRPTETSQVPSAN